MRKILSSVLLLSISIFCFSQSTTITYLNANNAVTDSAYAVFIKKTIFDNGIYMVSVKDRNGKMHNYCEYSSLEPLIENGNSAFYRKPDKLYAKGSYKDGKLSGIWYFYKNNEIIDSADYTYSSVYSKDLDCEITSTAKSSNKINSLVDKVLLSLDNYLIAAYNPPPRTFADFESFGLNIIFTIDVDGLISCIEIPETMHQDMDAEVIRLLKNFRYTGEIEEALKIVHNFKRIDEVFVIVDQMPKFRGGDIQDFRRHIKSRLKYPEEAAKNSEEGRVFITMAVDTNGDVIDVRIARGGSPALDAEAIRAVMNSPKWKPGKQSGRKVKVQFTFPIVFVL